MGQVVVAALRMLKSICSTLVSNNVTLLSTMRGNVLQMSCEPKVGAVNKSGAYIEDDGCVLLLCKGRWVMEGMHDLVEAVKAVNK